MDLGDILDIGGAGLAVHRKGTVAVSERCFGAADPRVVVAEDTGVLLVSRRIAGDLAQIQLVAGVGGLQQHHTVFGVQTLFHTGKCLCGLSALLADARHDAHALRLNKDLTLGALLAADGLAESIVGTAEPCAVPTGGQGGLLHGINVLAGGSGLLGQIQMVAQLGVFVAVLDEHTGNEYAFGYGTFAGAGDLEALARVLGEAVQVQAVVPVGAADQRQTVGTQMGAGKVEAAAQVLHQGLRLGGVVIKGHLLLQNGPVAGLPQVGSSTGNEPQRVIVEAGADIPVAFFGQGLVLVVGAAVLKLGGGDIQNALPGTGGDDMHKAQQILTAVPEAHAASGTAFVVAGGAAHVKGDHALVLMPDVDHAVQLFLTGFQMVGGQQLFPVGAQGGAGCIDLCIGGVALHHGMGAGLVDDARGNELFLLWVLDITQTKQDAAALAGGEGQVDVQRAHRCPAVGNAAGTVSGADGLRICRAAVYAAKGIPGGVEAVHRAVCPEHGVVVAALAVLGLVVDHAALYLYLTGGVVALEVGAVVHGIPQAELHIAEQVQLLDNGAAVAHCHPVQLTGIPLGDEQLLPGGHTVLFALQNGVAQTMAAAVTVQRGLGGLPARVPNGVAVLDIDPVAVHVQRGVIVAVTGQAAHPGVPVKAVTARRVGDQTEEVLAAKVVDPGQGCLRGGDDIFFILVIKISELHNASSLKLRLVRWAVHRLRKRLRRCERSNLITLSIPYPTQKCKSFLQKSQRKFKNNLRSPGGFRWLSALRIPAKRGTKDPKPILKVIYTYSL